MKLIRRVLLAAAAVGFVAALGLVGLFHSLTASTATLNPSIAPTSIGSTGIGMPDGIGAPQAPAVVGGNPNDPLSGSASNTAANTRPVTTGLSGDNVRTNTWAQLAAAKAFGQQSWYQACANTVVGMDWGTDVPKFEATEKVGFETRFILALNVSNQLTDAQIRAKAAADGNPNTGKLQVLRVNGYIVNTRDLGADRCNQFHDPRSMIRVSLGKIKYANGRFTGLDTTSGVFVDCHNLWHVVTTSPAPTPTPGSPTPSQPGSTPSTPSQTPTPPAHTCAPPETISPGGICVAPKNPSAGPTVHGGNPSPPASPQPKPTTPPATYSPPAPPTTHPAPSRSVPPPESPAPQPSAPATGCVPPPGMTC